MATEALILLATGSDRPGIVESISGVIYEAGCNLEDSRMSILGGEFALIVLIAGSSGNIERVRPALESLAADMDLTLQLKPAALRPEHAETTQAIPYHLHVVAMDHPGIVHKVTRLLSSRGVNVARLDTRLSYAPVTGTPVFSLDLDAHVPSDVTIPKLRAALRALAEDENIDIELRPAE